MAKGGSSMPRRHVRLLEPSIPATNPRGGAGWAGAWPPTAPAHAPFHRASPPRPGLTMPADTTPQADTTAQADTTPHADTTPGRDTAPGRDMVPRPEWTPILGPPEIPPDVSDADLWLGAVDLAARHAADPADPSRCGNPNCSDPQPYPCF